jgi:hypothetical protein
LQKLYTNVEALKKKCHHHPVPIHLAAVQLGGKDGDFKWDPAESTFTFDGASKSTGGIPGMIQRSGVLYYEYTIVKLGGTARVGFAVEGFSSNDVGDDSISWGVNGRFKSKWHNGGKEPWPCTWTEGDVVGLSANIDAGVIAVSKNGDWFDDGGGVVFEHEAIQAGVFPCLTAKGSKFRYAMTDFQHGAAAEDFWRRRSITAITIPPGTTSIPPMAYACYTSITSVEIPDTVTSIGEKAFFGCVSVTSVKFSGVLMSIGEMAFAGCTSMTSVELPGTVTFIEEKAFSGCVSITSVKFSGVVTSIGAMAFFGCTSTTGVEFSDSVTSIGFDAFKGCRLTPACQERYHKFQASICWIYSFTDPPPHPASTSCMHVFPWLRVARDLHLQ